LFYSILSFKKLKKVLITGANSGIGKATAIALVNLGYQLILWCRTEQKANEINQELNKISSIKHQTYWGDLFSRQDIVSVCKNIKENNKSIDGIIHNAGCVAGKQIINDEGVEMQLMVNHLSIVLINHLLKSSLEKSADPRIIHVSSRAHARGNVYFDDLNLSKNYSLSKAYNQSKLLNMMYCIYWAEILKKSSSKICITTFHPGLVNTSIGEKNTSNLEAFLWRWIKILGNNPKKATKDAVYLINDNNLKEISGKYFHDKKEIKPSKTAINKAFQIKAWEESLKILNIKTSEYGVF
jgi:NAD(P)-dependent dehydrogenase (short-subunit alcohol dehydrogenase family)